MNIEPGMQVHQHVTADAGYAIGVIGGDLNIFGETSPTPVYLLEQYLAPLAPDPAWLRELPSRMLNVRTGVVPFTGRNQERGDLHRWLETGSRLAVRWLHAPGGQGKTRLANQIAAHATADGWKVTVAAPHVGTVQALQASQDLRLDGHRGVLAIVDYADRYPLSTLIWLLRNSVFHHQGKPARVLMLARSASVWPALRATLEDPRVQAGASEQRLDPLPVKDGDRGAMFTAARDSFAAIYQIADPAVIGPPTGLDQTEFGLTLTVHVAALVAVGAHATNQQPDIRPDQLTRYLLDREREHWRHLYEGRTRGLDHHTPDSVMARTVFTAALTGALPHAEATALLRRVEQELPAERILTDHSRCYPPTDHHRAIALEPLYPDRLAEDFIAHTLPGPHHTADAWAPTRLDQLTQPPVSPSVKRRWWRRRDSTPVITPAYLARTLTFLTAAAARWPHLGPAYLYPLLRAQPQLAITAGSATLTTLATLQDIDIDVLEGIENLLPTKPNVDLDLASATVSTTITAHRLATTTDPAARASLHAHHAWRLANAGHRQQALAPSQQAVVMRRQLVEANPATYLPDLAGSLNNLGTVLSGLGRTEEALAPTQEAVVIRRRLAATNPAAHLPDLAMSLSNLGGWLSMLGRQDEALAPAQEAVAIRRRLATTDPAAYLPELADSLSNLGHLLSSMGRREEALAYSQEATELYRPLAEANPATHLPNLALSLTNLGMVRSGLAQWEEALASTQEALTICRRLAEANPTAYLPDLATSLSNLGIFLSELGRQEEALAPTQEAVVLRRRLVEANPAAYLPDLAMSLTNLGTVLSRRGRREEALAASEEATESYRRLAEANPAHLPSLATSLNNLGLWLSELGREEDALTRSQEAVVIRRRLADANPAAHLPDLAMSLNNLGVHLAELERWEEALTSSQDAADLYQRLAETNPAYLPDVAMSLVNLGPRLSQMGRQEEALAASEEATELYRRLAEANPVAHLPDLAYGLGAFAFVRARIGLDLPAALAAVEEAIAIYEDLAKQLPEAFAEQMSEMHDTLADVLGRLGRDTEAAEVRRRIAETSGDGVDGS